ncbi:MAG: galactokinase [Deltaproteobacteria bacterium]|nr:galactokinase [Deltaproteobacteria bacterium]
MVHSLQDLLSQKEIEASAPCRIDAGGTWDIKALALPMERLWPVTVNAALDLRTFVVLSPYEENRIKVSSHGFPRGKACHVDHIPFEPPFGLFFAALSYFGFHGLEVRIRSQSPVQSSLGGSSTALVALTKALVKASVMLGGKKLSIKEILHLTYHLEDAVAGGRCGLQDQAAAAYGGVNLWRWRYGHRTSPFERTPLLDRGGQKAFSRRLLVAYSGKRHISSRTNRDWIKGFLSGRTRAGWVKVNEIVHLLARAIHEQDWAGTADLLREEMTLRKNLTPEALTPVTVELVRQAEQAGCGARFAGAGAGGSIWALGKEENIQRLRKMWEGTLAPVRGAKVLHCQVDPLGVR